MTFGVSKAAATLSAVAVLLYLQPGKSSADDFIFLNDWARVSSAVSGLQLPPLQRVVTRYESGKDMVVVIQYPGGDEGSARAVELRDWLVSFGIQIEDIELHPGSGMPGAIAVSAEPRGVY